MKKNIYESEGIKAEKALSSALQGQTQDFILLP